MIHPLLKYTATQWWLWRQRHRLIDGPIHFRSALSSVRRILIHYPPEVSESTLRYVHQKIISFYPDSTVHYLVAQTFPRDHQAFLQTSSQSDDVMVVGEKDLRWFPFLNSKKIDMLRRKEFDLALDFCPVFDITFAHALHASGAPIIAGRCCGNALDGLHNLQVRVQNPETFPATLFDLLSRLRS